MWTRQHEYSKPMVPPPHSPLSVLAPPPRDQQLFPLFTTILYPIIHYFIPFHHSQLNSIPSFSALFRPPYSPPYGSPFILYYSCTPPFTLHSNEHFLYPLLPSFLLSTLSCTPLYPVHNSVLYFLLPSSSLRAVQYFPVYCSSLHTILFSIIV